MKKIIISRVDNIGDVILTLPMAGLIKQKYPDSFIYFLGKKYIQPIIELSKYVDQFLSWDEIKEKPTHQQRDFIRRLKADTIIHVFPNPEIAKLAKKAGIPNRIGTSRRLFHVFTCNRKLRLKRKNSRLHEAQLNIKLLEPLNILTDVPVNKIHEYYGFQNKYQMPDNIAALIDKEKFNLILHPKSKGSAREWGMDNFEKLISLLPDNKYKIFISGTTQEKVYMNDTLEKFRDKITDLTGQLNLKEFIAFIDACDGLIAASTGPLHIAAALGKYVIGLYAPMKPIFPTRWAPLGKNSHYFVINKYCDKCRKNPSICECIRAIKPQEVVEKLNSFTN